MPLSTAKKLLLGLLGGGSTAPVIPPFVPLDEPTMFFALESNVGTFQDAAGTVPAAATNDPIMLVTDQKGGYHVTCADNVDYKPLLELAELNGHPAIIFDGIKDYLNNTSLPGTSPLRSCIAVFQQIDGAASIGVLVEVDIPNNSVHRISMTGQAVNMGAIGAPVSGPMRTIDAGPSIDTFIVNGADSRMFLAGGLRASGTVGSTPVANGLTIGKYLIGGSASPESQLWPLHFKLFALYFFHGGISRSLHERMGLYLKNKYALPFSLSIETFQHNIYSDLLWRVETEGGGQDYTKPQYVRTSAACEYVFETDATEIIVECYNNTYGYASGAWSTPKITSFGIRVNGADFATIAPTAFGTTYHTIALPPGAKTIELVSSFRHAGLSSGPRGVNIVAVTGNGSYHTPVTRTTDNRLMIQGDSIAAAAAWADSPALQGWGQLIRNVYPGHAVLIDGWSSGTLYERCYDTTTINAEVAKIVSANPSGFIQTLGINDWGLIGYAEYYADNAAFEAKLAAYVDAIHTSLPDLEIYLQSPLITVDREGAKLTAMRASYAAVVAARSAYCTYVHGPDICSVGNLYDMLHPNTAGYAQIFGNYKTILGL